MYSQPIDSLNFSCLGSYNLLLFQVKLVTEAELIAAFLDFDYRQ